MPDRHTDTKISPRQSNIGRSNAKRLQNLCHVAEFFQPPWKKMLLLCKVLLMWDVSYKTTTWWISAPLARHIWHASAGSSSKKISGKIISRIPYGGLPAGCTGCMFASTSGEPLYNVLFLHIWPFCKDIFCSRFVWGTQSLEVLRASVQGVCTAKYLPSVRT